MIRMICFFVCLLTLTTANATLITSGNIFETAGGSSVDHWGFTTSGGVVSIDILSYESYRPNASTGTATDVNGDGEIAFIDPFIYLFSDDGALDSGDYIAHNNDSSFTFSDGSVSEYDSYLSATLNAGNYILAIGSYVLDLDEAISGLNDSAHFLRTCSGAPGEACGRFQRIDHGDYQITWSGSVTLTSDPGTAISVPEPASFALIIIGLIAIQLIGKGQFDNRRRFPFGKFT